LDTFCTGEYVGEIEGTEIERIRRRIHHYIVFSSGLVEGKKGFWLGLAGLA